MRIDLLLPLALSFLSVRGLAQQVAPFEEELAETTGDHYWGALADAQFGEIVVGEFTGDAELDAVVMNGDFPMLLISPETILTSLLVPESVLDLALLPGAGNAVDSIVTVGTAGLRKHTWDAVSQSFWSETLQGGVWTGMSSLEVADFDGSGKQGFVGVLASGSIFAGLLLPGNDGGYAFGRIAALDIVDNAVAVDWDGDGDDEVALTTGYGLEVYEANGTPVFVTPWDGALLAVPFVEPGGARERLAVVATAPDGIAQYLVVAGAEGIEGPYGLGPLGVVALAAGDLDADGDEELILGVSTATSVFVLDNLSEVGQQTFDPIGAMEGIEVGDGSRDPASNRAGIGVGDFDFDGDLDLLLPLQGDATGSTQIPGEVPSTIFLLANDTTDQSVFTPPVLGSKHFFEMGVSLDIEVELGEPAQLLPVGAGETLALEITLWHTPALGQPTQTTPIWTHSMALPFPAPSGGGGGGVSAPVPGELFGGGASGETFVFSTGQTGVEFDDIYSLVIRQVSRDSQGGLVLEGTALTALYAAAENTESLQALVGAQSYVMSLAPPLPGGGIGESLDAGGLTLGPAVPPFSLGGPPNN